MPGNGRPEQEVLAGRDGDLEQVLDLVRDAVVGRSGSLLIVGEAGVGKTSLARRASADADGAGVGGAGVGDEGAGRADASGRADAGGGVACLWGTCLPLLSTAVPFLPLTAASRDWARAAGVAVPDLGGRGAAPAVFDAWLDELCGRQPVLLVVDDLQWADQGSLDVLMFLLAGPQRRRLAVVATIREGETGRYDLRRWLADVRRLPRVRELRLAPLDRVATGQLIAGRLGAPPHQTLIEEVFTRSRGNAYLATLLVRDLPANATELPPGLPGELREAVARAWFGLSEAARDLARLLAVAGRPQRAGFLREVAGELIPGLEVTPAIREAVRAGVLGTEPDGGCWFAHPLLAEVLEAELPPEEARAWHAGFAVALTRQMAAVPPADGAAGDPDGGYAVALADHYMRAGDLPEAFRWALRGAAAAESAGGSTEALRLLHRALDLQPAAGDPDTDRAAVLQRIRAVAERTGAPEAELSAIDELLVLVDSGGDPLLVVDLLVRRMWLRQNTGQEFAGSGGLGRAVELASAYPQSPQYARALAGMARVESWGGLPSAPARAAQAVAVARASGSASALSYALAARVMTWVMDTEARPYDGDPVQDGRLAQSLAAEARDFYAYMHATVWTANAANGTASHEWAEISRQGREHLTAMGGPHAYVAWLASFEAESLLLLGEWRACEERLRIAFGAPPGTGGGTSCRLAAARLAAWQGRWAEAEGHLARAGELFAEQSGFLGLPFDAVRAELAIARGDTEQAFTIALAGLRQRADMGERLLPAAARAAADQAGASRDRGESAAPALARLDHLRDTYPTVPQDPNAKPSEQAQCAAMQALYLAEQARGRCGPDVTAAWVTAAESCAAAGLAWDETYARWRAAESSLPRRSDRAATATQLRRAHELATDLAARPFLDQIEALAASAGIRLPAARPAPVAGQTAPLIPGLTGRETEILQHLVAGRTYREIAGALFISEKTVSAHVSNLLRKTGTSSRAELAQKYRRLAATATTR
jgi:DNA-binding CsgD family transcriptional regulator